MQQLADQLGIQTPQHSDLGAAGIVLAFCFLAWAAALLSGRSIGPRLADFWSRVAGGRAEGIAARMGDVTRYVVAALILAVAVYAYPWPDLAEFILGFALALWVGLLVRTLVRGLHLPRWAALLLAASAFVAILSNVIDGLEPVTRVLSRAAFSIGSTRLSLLTLLQGTIALLILFAVFRLIGRVADHSIRDRPFLTPHRSCWRRSLSVFCC